MTSKAPILLIGHSHVACIAAAAQADLAANVHVVELAKLDFAGKPTAKIVEMVLQECPKNAPRAVGLCLGGNEHNVMGILENPLPFALGDAATGSAPSDANGRHFIPHQMMLDHYKSRTNFPLMRALYAAFPQTRRFYLNPPPPINDWAHIAAHPKKFGDRLHLGPPPDALKLRLFEIQTEVFQDFAAGEGATFIATPNTVLNAGGFLSADYFDKDPTHGNRAYGAIMLTQIVKAMGHQR